MLLSPTCNDIAYRNTSISLRDGGNESNSVVCTREIRYVSTLARCTYASSVQVTYNPGEKNTNAYTAYHKLAIVINVLSRAALWVLVSSDVVNRLNGNRFVYWHLYLYLCIMCMRRMRCAGGYSRFRKDVSR